MNNKIAKQRWSKYVDRSPDNRWNKKWTDWIPRDTMCNRRRLLIEDGEIKLKSLCQELGRDQHSAVAHGDDCGGLYPAVDL